MIWTKLITYFLPFDLQYCKSIMILLFEVCADITVWLQYAAFEEINTKDFDRTRDVYKAAIKLVPHREFTFAKVSSTLSQLN